MPFTHVAQGARHIALVFHWPFDNTIKNAHENAQPLSKPFMTAVSSLRHARCTTDKCLL